MSELKCPGCSTLMEQKELKKRKNIREVDIEYPVNAYVCPRCGLEAGTVKTAGEVQRAMAEAYRRKTGRKLLQALSA
jgi:NMD protein affecting ribosome stability and mRNA decay